jgi:drug/metabolite transporter (DMT)-like permease
MNFFLWAALVVPPFLWGSNAIVGRMAAGAIPPVTMNSLRWSVAFVVLLPFIYRAAVQHRHVIAANWRHIAISGFFGITCYNSLQYLALTTSGPINTSLIGASVPVFILVVGRLLFNERISTQSAFGAALSMAGVIWVMLRGNIGQLGSIGFEKGDLYMLAGTCAWSIYTWLLKRDRSGLPRNVLLGSQIAAGLLCSVPLVIIEQTWGGYAPIAASLRVFSIVGYIGVFPSLIAYFCWQKAVASTSAQLPIFFMNLTPIFTVLLSIALLGDFPHIYHGVGLALILAGIAMAHRGTMQKTPVQDRAASRGRA